MSETTLFLILLICQQWQRRRFITQLVFIHIRPLRRSSLALFPLFPFYSKKNIHIPMQGEIDSMNVSVAAGILLFEVKKQRNFN